MRLPLRRYLSCFSLCEDHNDGALNVKLQIGKAKTPIFVASREDIHCYVISIRMIDGFCYLKHSGHCNERVTVSHHLQYPFLYPVSRRRSILETEKANIKMLFTQRVCFFLFLFSLSFCSSVVLRNRREEGSRQMAAVTLTIHEGKRRAI